MFTFLRTKQKRASSTTQRITTQHLFDHDNLKIGFTLVRSCRRKPSLQVYPDLRVVVRAPITYQSSDAILFLKNHQPWLEKTLTRMATLPPKKEKIIKSGEKYIYFGKALTVDIVDGLTHSIIVQDDTLRITITPTTKIIDKKMMLWEKAQLTTVIHKIIEYWSSRMHAQHRIQKICIKKMKSRWGSCNSRGVLTFNLDLIERPENVIEYIVLHELCHLFELNHSVRFYALLTKYCPGWKALKKAL